MLDQKATHVEKEENVHSILAHSYSVYFFLFLIGLSLDFIFGYKVFSGVAPVGFFFLFLATGIIFWAQKTGRDLRKVVEVKTEHFCRGPYCYTRIPTQWGLFFLLLSFGIITNSIFIVIFTIIAFFISKFVFMSKHERILAEKYGTAYIEYMKLVKF